MAEPTPLVAAREHLSRAESDFRSEDGLFHLEEGMALLEEVALDSATEYQAIAANLLSTYSTRICESIKKLVEADPGLPQPDLEHLFKILLAFDSGDLKLPEYVRALKIDIVRRLIDLCYEGYSAEDKEKMLRQLAGIAGSRSDRG